MTKTAEEMHDLLMVAAAWSGLALNPSSPVEDRLNAALQAIERYVEYIESRDE